jgi:hypothetical protein
MNASRIPEHLKYQSASAMLAAIEARNEPLNFYKMLVLIALKDALCAADGVGDDLYRAAGAEGRAIAFLNQAVPDVPDEAA